MSLEYDKPSQNGGVSFAEALVALNGYNVPQTEQMSFEVALGWLQMLTGVNYLGFTNFTILLYPNGSQKLVRGDNGDVLMHLTAECANQALKDK